MTSNPFISVIIPTCNRQEMMMKCLASVLDQSFRESEVIVIDQDPRRTLERAIAQAHPGESRVRYLFKDRAGAAGARNLGIEMARGPVVAFIDDDAFADHNWLRAIAEAFSNYPRPALIAGRIKPVWEGGRPAWFPPEREFLMGLYDSGAEICQMPKDDFPIGANMAGWREVIVSMGGFEERLGPNYFRKRPMMTGEESILGRRIAMAGHTLLYQPAALVWHQISSRKATRSYFLKRHFWEGVTTVEQLALLDQVGKHWPHYKHHSREMAMAFARFCLTSYENRYPHPHPTIRMLALARFTYSVGVLYGLATLPSSSEQQKARCASV